MTKLKRLFRSPFTQLYDEAGFTQTVRRGLMFVIFGNLCGNLFFNITQGTALVGLAEELGATDFKFGILMAIPLFGAVIQIPAAMIVSRAGKRKKFMLTFGVMSRFMWILIGIVPYVIPMSGAWMRLWAVIFLVGISSVGGSFINICFTPWLADLVPLRIRGRWIASRDRIASIMGVCAGILTALVLDYSSGFTGYAIVFIVGGAFGVLDLICFIAVKETPMVKSATQGLFPILKRIVKDKKFFRFMVFWTVWAFATNFGGAFTVRYALGPLELSFIHVTVAGQITAALITVAVISKWGRTIDHYGSKPVLMITCLVQSLILLIMLFSRPGSVIPFLFVNLIGAAFWSAANLACVNMQLSCSPDDQRAEYIAIFTCVTSLLGAFLGVFLGGAFLEWLPELMIYANITINGRLPDHFKILFVVSCIFRLLTVIIFVPRLENDQDSNLKELAEDFCDRIKQYSPRNIYRILRGRR